MALHLPLAGSNCAAWRTGKPVPGPTTSSALAPENAITVPSGRATPVEYQRALLRAPVAVEVKLSPAAVSTVLMTLVLCARYVPGEVPRMPPAARKEALVYGGLSGSM